MTQHVFRTTQQDRPIQVLAGWDRPLQGFFLTIEYRDSNEDEFLFNNLELECSHRKSFSTFESALSERGISLPPRMIETIREDRDLNRGDEWTDWTATPDDPSGHAMAEWLSMNLPITVELIVHKWWNIIYELRQADSRTFCVVERDIHGTFSVHQINHGTREEAAAGGKRILQQDRKSVLVHVRALVAELRDGQR